MRSVSFIGVYEDSGIAVSVVIPCLNEEAGVADVVGDAWAGIEAIRSLRAR